MGTLHRIDEYLKVLEEKEEKKGKEYDDFYKSMLKKFNVESPQELSKEKQKEFYDAIDKGWKAKKETD